MNRIVRENYPVAALPEDLRTEVAGLDRVRVVLETDVAEAGEPRPSLQQLFARARPSFRDADDVADHFATMRAEWD